MREPLPRMVQATTLGAHGEPAWPHCPCALGSTCPSLPFGLGTACPLDELSLIQEPLWPPLLLQKGWSLLPCGGKAFHS